MPIAEITALISSAKTAYDIAKGVSSLSAEVQRNESISKILEALIAIQSEALAMQEKYQRILEEKNELKTKLREFEQWSETERLYELKDLGGNVFVYAFKMAEGSNEPMHYVCANCFKDRKKSILQCLGTASYGTTYHCQACDAKIIDKSNKSSPPPPRRGPRYFK